MKWRKLNINLYTNFLQSWTYWDYWPFWNPSTGEPNTDFQSFLSRPYPKATSGTPIKLSFDYETKEFNYEFNLDTSIDQPTEIFIPPLTYSSQAQLDIDLSDSLSWNLSPDDPNVIFVRPNVKQLENPVYVRFRPAVQLVKSVGRK